MAKFLSKFALKMAKSVEIRSTVEIYRWDLPLKSTVVIYRWNLHWDLPLKSTLVFTVEIYHWDLPLKSDLPVPLLERGKSLIFQRNSASCLYYRNQLKVNNMVFLVQPLMISFLCHRFEQPHPTGPLDNSHGLFELVLHIWLPNLD